MRISESASGLQKGSVMKAMRVIILAAAVLTGCGAGVEDDGSVLSTGQAAQGLTTTCYEVNCAEMRGNVAPPETQALPQDPVPLHTGRTQPSLTGEPEVIRPR